MPRARHPAARRAPEWHIVERDNPLALHSIHGSRESAERHLRDVVPGYVARGFYMDKTLTADSFIIVYRPG